jgi:hypothetical protein
MFLASWLFNAAYQGFDAYSDGGNFFEAFLDGLFINPSVSVFGYFGSDGIHWGERPGTTGSFAVDYNGNVGYESGLESLGYQDISDDLELYFDPERVEYLTELINDPAYGLASNGPGGAIPEWLYNNWRAWQNAVGKMYEGLERGSKIGKYKIDWMPKDAFGNITKALEAKYVKFIENRGQLRTFAVQFGKKFELHISEYTQKISPTLVNLIDRTGGKIMRCGKALDLGALYRAGGVVSDVVKGINSINITIPIEFFQWQITPNGLQPRQIY